MSDQVDALVTAITPGLGDQPGVTPRDVVLVIGPWLAGTTSLLEALRRELPDQRFVGADELGPDEAPAAVVFAVSAVAPLTESDCVLLDAAAANTDLVIGAVTKIDLHRPWRDVLAADRKALAAHDDRYRDVTWVGAAAAPELGEQQLDELVDALQLGLADPELTRRNRLRAWQFRIDSAIRRCRDDVAGMGREAAALRDQRREVLRRRRLTRSERTIELRSQIQQARVQLTYFARNRCTSVRTELQEDAAGATRRRLAAFENYVRTRVDEVVDDVNGGVTAHLTDVAVDLGLTPPSEEPVAAESADFVAATEVAATGDPADRAARSGLRARRGVHVEPGVRRSRSRLRRRGPRRRRGCRVGGGAVGRQHPGAAVRPGRAGSLGLGGDG